jgi:ABC-type multidrug transport system ATPase subunit
VFARLGSVSADRVDAVLDLFALTEFADRPTQELSGGMLQRLGLAVAFLREAPLLVLDEPTVNLDPTGIERLQKLLQELKKANTSILFSSHRLHTAMQLADRVGVLVGGRMVTIEEVSEFKDAVSRRTAVRIVMSGTSDTEKTRAAAEQAVAEVLDCGGSQIRFIASPEQRLEVIRAIEDAGGEIDEFHTEAPDWQALMRTRFDSNGEGRS